MIGSLISDLRMITLRVRVHAIRFLVPILTLGLITKGQHVMIEACVIVVSCSCVLVQSRNHEIMKCVLNKRLRMFICGSFVRCRVIASANILNI